MIFGLGFSFTNFHVITYGVRENDGEWLNRFRNRLVDVGDSTKRKRAEAQLKYRKERKLRLQMGYRS